MLMTKPSEVKPIASVLSPLDRDEIERRALAISASLARRRGDDLYFAEVYPDVTPAWHLVRVAPGQERDAIDDLVKRRFGVYDPWEERRYFLNGMASRSRTARRRILPGYLLVFVWDIDEHWGRITACKGVLDVLCRAGTGKAVVVPDSFVARLQGLELSTLPDVVDAIQEARAAAARAFNRATKRKRSRSAWKDRRDIEAAREAMSDAGELVIHTKSHFQVFMGLEPSERISFISERLAS